MQMNLTHFLQSLTHHSVLNWPDLRQLILQHNWNPFWNGHCANDTGHVTRDPDTWAHVSMPLVNYSLVWWQWLVARRMSVCPLSSLGPRYTERLKFHSTLILWVGPWICECLTTHKFPMFNVSDENKSQLRFWESFKFSRDSRWISSWSHSFI